MEIRGIYGIRNGVAYIVMWIRLVPDATVSEISKGSEKEQKCGKSICCSRRFEAMDDWRNAQ
jgi:hypothetical protein